MVHHGQPRTRRSGADLQSPSHGVRGAPTRTLLEHPCQGPGLTGRDSTHRDHGFPALDQDVVDQGVEERFASLLRSIATRTCSARSDSSCGVGG